MEAALVLKENSQQPWKPVEDRTKATEKAEEAGLEAESGMGEVVSTESKRQRRAAKTHRKLKQIVLRQNWQQTH